MKVILNTHETQWLSEKGKNACVKNNEGRPMYLELIIDWNIPVIPNYEDGLELDGILNEEQLSYFEEYSFLVSSITYFGNKELGIHPVIWIKGLD